MRIQKGILLIILFVYVSLAFAQDESCTLTLRGRVIDNDTQLPLSGVTIKVSPGIHQTISDGHGYFQFSQLCEGTSYTVMASSIGFDSITTTLTLAGNETLNITLSHGHIKLHDVDVVGHQQSVVTTNPSKAVSREAIAEARGGTLAGIFDALPGVSMLQTGSTIAKPVINGMYGNRILILNNGVRQEGQQWGSEHAPEIDPFMAKDFKLIKGAEGVRYGADAIGGVILVSSPPLPVDPHLSGEIHTLYSTNGQIGVLSGMLQSGINRIKGLSWRVQGTAKRGGNIRAADYYLGNTGVGEYNFSAALQYSRATTSLDAYYSRFYTSLGILTSAHIGDIDDIQARVDAGRPLENYGFSYQIQPPRQRAVHDLGKIKWHQDLASGASLDIQYGLQRNHRQEYDIRRGDRDALPMLDMVLTTQTLDASYHTPSYAGWTTQVGSNLMLQVNNNVPGTLNTPIIPNYDSFTAGLFAIQRLVKDTHEWEAGLRYDFRTFDAAGYDSQLEYYGGYRQFHNLSGTVGGVLHLHPDWQLRSNIGLAWRAPNANELYSSGLHQGAALYEIGDPDMESEQSYKWMVSPSYSGERFSFDLDVYAQYIHHYIYAQPSAGEFLQSIRGTFPIFRYVQTNASFWGIDFAGQYRMPVGLSYHLNASIIRAKDTEHSSYLPYIPADRADHHLRWEIPLMSNSLQHTYAKLEQRIVLRQTRYEPESDYAAPPPAYQLYAVYAGTQLSWGDRTLDITLSATNLFNKQYKEYMNRFRYFSHDIGRNMSIKLAYSF
ncbi:TonB-dependent receptor [Parapedobacter tibetensis]|uniref:TonB-dependent receptor n=1 Tax=Parapedobacter tibetensis TaxID=2972951 RepID=UPI00214D8D2C|nr:TonB-dependent receptor [Parapedobacter tibetensis]